MKIILSAGHSPRRAGAYAFGTKEHDLNTRVTDAVARALVDRGIHVVILGPISTLAERTKIMAEQAKGSFHIAIEFHHNVFNGKARGSEIFYKAGDKRSFDIGKRLLAITCDRVGLKNRGMKLASASARGSLAWVKTDGCILWEVCFMDNKDDLELLKDLKVFADTLVDELIVGTL